MENEDIINFPMFFDGENRPFDELRPDFNSTPQSKPIVIPENFKIVVLKMCPEIKDIVSVGYRNNKMYDPMTFNPVYNYLVGVDLYFDEKYGMKKSKKEYKHTCGNTSLVCTVSRVCLRKVVKNFKLKILPEPIIFQLS